eukprot:8796620-Pyramimonas_sp.AAC.1
MSRLVRSFKLGSGICSCWSRPAQVYSWLHSCRPPNRSRKELVQLARTGSRDTCRATGVLGSNEDPLGTFQTLAAKQALSFEEPQRARVRHPGPRPPAHKVCAVVYTKHYLSER